MSSVQHFPFNYCQARTFPEMKAVEIKPPAKFRASIVEIKSTGFNLGTFYAVINMFRFTSLYHRQ